MRADRTVQTLHEPGRLAARAPGLGCPVSEGTRLRHVTPSPGAGPRDRLAAPGHARAAGQPDRAVAAVVEVVLAPTPAHRVGTLAVHDAAAGRQHHVGQRGDARRQQLVEAEDGAGRGPDLLRCAASNSRLFAPLCWSKIERRSTARPRRRPPTAVVADHRIEGRHPDGAWSTSPDRTGSATDRGTSPLAVIRVGNHARGPDPPQWQSQPARERRSRT